MAWQGIARALAARGTGSGGLLLLHSPGESVDRALESRGLQGRPPGGTLDVSDPDMINLVERAVRSENRRISAFLGQEGVPAVGFVGGDRGLLRERGSTSWLIEVTRRGTIPVVSTAVPYAAGIRELTLGQAVEWVCEVEDTVAVLLGEVRNDAGGASTPIDHSAQKHLESRGISTELSTISGLRLVGTDR